MDLYSDLETEARKRLDAREPDDWPIRAAALALGCPIWTEDADFWTSSAVASQLGPSDAHIGEALGVQTVSTLPALIA
ncbi:MAG: PIN domain-containing protein [Bryobacteraceae bacterium]